MREVEVKIIDINKQDVIKKIEELGARKVFEGKMLSLDYDFPHKLLRKRNSSLRVRTIGQKCQLTFKQRLKRQDAKVSREIQTDVSSLRSIRTILYELGLAEFKKSFKYRISYELNDVHFDIDTIDGYPTFMEVETHDIETLRKYVEVLGFKMEDTKPWSVRDLIEHYKQV